MIEIKINEVAYPVPTNWKEVNMSQYTAILKAIGKPFYYRMALYSGIPIDTINLLQFPQVQLICELTEFMDSHETVLAFALDYESEFKIGEAEYWKIEKAKQLLKDCNPYLKCIEIVDLYTSDKDGKGGEDISNASVVESIGKAAFFLRKFQSSFSDIKDLTIIKPQTNK